MYRKVGDLDFSSNFQSPSQSYGALKFSKPNIPIDDIFQQSYKLKDEHSRMIPTGQTKKAHRAHTRNFSDFTVPVTRRLQSESTCYEKPEDNKLKSLQSRVHRIQEMLKQFQSKMQQFRISDIQKSQNKYHKLENQTDHKLLEITSCLSELKMKVDKINGNFTQNAMNLFTFRSEIEPSSGIDLSSQKINKFVEKIAQVNHMLIETIRKQFKIKINQLNQKVRGLYSNKAYQQAANPQNQFFKTNRKYSGNPISFLYEQYIKRSQKSKQKNGNKQNSYTDLNTSSVCLNQITYYIDPEGFLLDDSNNYLVNGQMKQIRLSEKELRMLRRHNILLQ